MNSLLSEINGFVWGPFTLWLIGLTGLYLMLGLKFQPLIRIGFGFREAIASIRSSSGDGDVSAFKSLTTALAATIGTGNVAGVAGAIAVGGPGAVFWMWMIALVGMATKYAESLLAVHYREVDELGEHVGGPMYFIRNGLGKNWAWMGWLFAFFGALAGFGIGNGVQANAMAEALQVSFGIPPLLTGIVVASITLAVLIGGIERIGQVTQIVVPLMAAVYVIGALVILAANLEQIPGAFGLIFSNAFNGEAAAGGSLGVVIQRGIARGVFSNESGLGTAPIAQAAAKPGDPVLQGSVAMIGTFIDTIVICSMTALVIIISGLYSQADYVSGAKNVSLTINAFGSALPGFDWIVVFGTIFFTLTTILGWGYYSEKCLEYMAGVKAIRPFRLVWVAVVVFGAVASGGVIWTIAEILNGLMAIPNLIGLLLLSPVVFRLTRSYDFKTRQQSTTLS
ncbi:sodium:alanine symporter family protein [Synechococcus sp. CC9311]|uniref:alanine/glycine:cation symporter family protein n=1 Tax=Synechococcus sp. (strain CC9311) TaxID=64471 RepID=UPI0000DDADA6|nr:sodium:alanine symporter family protein [Synechococcus sp. CC9311]ABI45471.1 Sodium:alanine symporter family protein [Synechococcus sp. CC9311]